MHPNTRRRCSCGQSLRSPVERADGFCSECVREADLGEDKLAKLARALGYELAPEEKPEPKP
jgi:NMD protein affecting ribosome stability and mRNA decay